MVRSRKHLIYHLIAICILVAGVMTGMFSATAKAMDGNGSTPEDGLGYCYVQIKHTPVTGGDLSPYGYGCYWTEKEREAAEDNLPGWHQIGQFRHEVDASFHWSDDILTAVAWPDYCGNNDGNHYISDQMPPGWNNKVTNIYMKQTSGCSEMILYQYPSFGGDEAVYPLSTCDGHYIGAFDNEASSFDIY